MNIIHDLKWNNLQIQMHPPEYSKRLKKILRSKINQLEYKMAQQNSQEVVESNLKPPKQSKKKHCSFTIISIHNKKKTSKMNKCSLMSKLK